MERNRPRSPFSSPPFFPTGYVEPLFLFSFFSVLERRRGNGETPSFSLPYSYPTPSAPMTPCLFPSPPLSPLPGSASLKRGLLFPRRRPSLDIRHPVPFFPFLFFFVGSKGRRPFFSSSTKSTPFQITEGQANDPLLFPPPPLLRSCGWGER